MKVVGLIPARFASSRFPGKPLALVAGKPLLEHVVQRCRLATSLADLIVATDDERICKVAETFCKVAMTRDDHISGTDRIAEVVQNLECDGVVNIQGDEPRIHPDVIDAVAGALNRHGMTTAAVRLNSLSEFDNPNVVKVVHNVAGEALYFSRRCIPYLRDLGNRGAAEQMASFSFLKHLGIYGYRRETLLQLVQYPPSPLELAERLEQLRALDNGIPIGVAVVDHESIGVDVPGDIARVEELLRQEAGKVIPSRKGM